MPKKILLNEQEVLAMYARCDNCREVADAFGVSNEHIRRILIKRGVCRTANRRYERKHHPAKCAQRDNCYALFRMIYDNTDLNALDIAKMLGANITTVWNACCKSRGIYGRANVAEFDLELIEQEYLGGATSYELGEKYGVRHETISRWMRKRGLCIGKGKGNHARNSANEFTCECCGVHFVSYAHNAKCCSESCARKNRSKNRKWGSDYKKRCEHFGVEYDKSITLKTVYERDNGICYICGNHCDFDDVLPSGAVGNSYPTIDHVVALSNGGGHTHGNVKLACWLCNSVKQDRVLTDELRKLIIECKVTACS